MKLKTFLIIEIGQLLLFVIFAFLVFFTTSNSDRTIMDGAPKQPSAPKENQACYKLENKDKMVINGIDRSNNLNENDYEKFYNSLDEYKDKIGVVPDYQTALSVAISVWKPLIGETKIQDSAPYRIQYNAEGDFWSVRGSLPPNSMGSVITAEIDRKTGAILLIGLA